MRRMFNAVVVAGFLAALPAFSQFGQLSQYKTTIRLILSAETARPGDTIMAGVRLEMAPHWHTYWRNPGLGIPTKIQWTLPPGVTAGDVQWPVPEKFVSPPPVPLTTYGYEHEATLLVPLKIGPQAATGPLEIKAHVTWQECDEECVSGKGDVSAQLAIGAETKSSPDVAAIEAAKNRLPKSEPKITVSAHWEKDGEKRPLILDWQTTDKPAQVDFFPYGGADYEIEGETERLPDQGGNIRIRKLVSKSENAWPSKIEGLLVTRSGADTKWEGHEVSLTLTQLTAEAPGHGVNASLLLKLWFAFLGGLILNVMPCVLPVIALKVLGFTNQAKETPQRVRMLGSVYGAGVLVSFLVLAAIAIAVQLAGGIAGWGMALQNPQFRVVVTVLITLVALNLFGVFEVNLSGGAMNAAGSLASKEGIPGAFFNGMLATVLATPCAAPYLTGALTLTAGESPAAIILLFLMVGVGLAAPFVLLCWQPNWLKFLPKPGLWMQRFKVAMGFPMLATAMWLFWATATRMGKTGVFWLGMFLVVVAMASWIWGEFAQRGTKRRGLAMSLSLMLVIAGYVSILENQLHWRAPSVVAKEADGEWKPWSELAVAKARDEGHPVMVEFTADLCVNCLANRLTSIDIKSTRDKLKEIGAITLVGDFTDADAAIAKELQKFGRAGVPLVLVYPADKNADPIVLPPILTPGIVLEALNKAGRYTPPSVASKDK